MSDTEALLITILSCCLPLLCAGGIGGGIVYWVMSNKKKKMEEEALLVNLPIEKITQEKEEPAAVELPQKKATGFRPSSVGTVSQQLGFDVRDAHMAGLSLAEAEALSKERKSKLVYTETEMRRLVYGLWADEDPNEKDYREARKAAGAYRKGCVKKLRKIGKDAIPYLEPYADREEVVSLLGELKNR